MTVQKTGALGGEHPPHARCSRGWVSSSDVGGDKAKHTRNDMGEKYLMIAPSHSFFIVKVMFVDLNVQTIKLEK